MVNRCGHQHTVEEAEETLRWLRGRPDNTLNKQLKDGETAMINVKYVVIPKVAGSNISVERIRANHAFMNKVYGAKEGWDPEEKVAPTARYPWTNNMPNPKVGFYPLDESKISADNGNYIVTKAPSESTVFDSVADVKEWYTKNHAKMQTGCIYIFITRVGSGNILGVADAIGINTAGWQALCVDHGTIGSPDTPGLQSPYNLGFTLIHEMGHKLNLYHPFPGGGNVKLACDSAAVLTFQQYYPEYPKRVYNNAAAKAAYRALTANDDTDNAYDNVGRDFLLYAKELSNNDSGGNPGAKKAANDSLIPYSCQTFTTDSTNYVGDNFMLVMDYTDDNSMLGFSPTNVEHIRAFLDEYGSYYGMNRLTNASDVDSNTVWYVLGGIAILLVVISGLYWYNKYRTKKSEPYFIITDTTIQVT